MTSKNAFLSIDNLVASWCFSRGKSETHYYLRVAKLAADAVRELSLSFIPMVNHKLLTKQEGATWFMLPLDYMDYVSVGIRIGERWRPIPVSKSLMPIPNQAGGGEFGSDMGSDFNVDGDWTGWLNPQYAQALASFNSAQFGSQFQTSSYTLSGATSNDNVNSWSYPYGNALLGQDQNLNSWGESTGRNFGGGTGLRGDVVSINPEYGVIMCPYDFPVNHLYLVYTGLGDIDTMSHIPIQAQAAIEAWIDWKYHARKRNVSKSEVGDYERIYYDQQKIMIARFSDLGKTELYRILNKYYSPSPRTGGHGEVGRNLIRQDNGSASSSGSTSSSTPAQAAASSFVHTVVTTGTSFTDTRLANRNVLYIITGGQAFFAPADFTKLYSSTTLTSTTLNFAATQQILVVLA